MLEYKGYVAHVELDPEVGIYDRFTPTPLSAHVHVKDAKRLRE